MAGDKTRIALLGLVLGSPGNPGQVKDFLLELFNDPYMLDLPFRKFLARIIADRRAPKAVAKYEMIGGKSPLMEISRSQVSAIADLLNDDEKEVQPFLAARYLEPSLPGALSSIASGGFDIVVALPLYPHQSRVTTGSSLARLHSIAPDFKLSGRIIEIGSYCDHPGYISSLASTVEQALKKLGTTQKDTHLLFAAHSIPLKLAGKGDPYPGQVKRTVQAILEKLKWTGTHSLAFQSRAGPVSWLGPGTSEEVKRLAASGTRNILVVPTSFVSDHLETLFDLDIELARIAAKEGIKGYARAPALNDRPEFISALALMVNDEISRTTNKNTSMFGPS
ncbi:MAG: ferrochelatase [Deltaproteobacteria bacterium]|nr:ferrochelatase [Deltaproteobacteria bacterium]